MINVDEMKYKDSRWQDIFLFLKNKGYNIYSPSTKEGECKEKYIVLKNDGATKHPSFSTMIDLYTVLCYVPKQNYSQLEPYVQQVKKDLKEIEPLIKPYGLETQSYYDDTIKAHMISVQYKNYKKM